MYCTPPSDGAAVQQQIQHTVIYCTTPSNGAAVQPQIPDTTKYCTTPSNSEYNIQPCTCTTPPNGAAVQLRIQHTTMYVPCHTVRRCRCPTANTTYNHVLYYTARRSPLSNSKYNIHKLLYHTVLQCCCPTANTIYNNCCTKPFDGAAVQLRIQHTTMYVPCHTVRRCRCPTANTICNNYCTKPPDGAAVQQQIQYTQITIPHRPTVPLSDSQYNIQQLLYQTVRRCRCPTANTINTNYCTTPSDGAAVRQRIQYTTITLLRHPTVPLSDSEF
uniref:Uncharacterized protein n=1 Tax=Branchiostoma floridae TaxID=7739 RepID=C3Y0V5_BRAFL|eukprot:XP_002610078.1 hypothetical protein BRAFLDRAFT_89890 [Branchiostoma floridae]